MYQPTSDMKGLCLLSLMIGFATGASNSEDIYLEGNSLTIGVIADGSGPEQLLSVTKFGYNFTVVLASVDTKEPFKIFSAVQRLGNRNDVDVIILFDYDSRLLSIKQLSPTGHQKLITLEKQHDSREQDRQNNSLDDGDCWKDAQSTRSIEEPYCDTDLYGSSETIVSADEAASIATTALTRMVVEKLKWRQLVILHETETDTQTTALSDRLSRAGVMFSIYNMDTTADFNATLAKIYRATMRERNEINFVVLCRPRCVRKILNTANLFDSHTTIHTTLLKQFSRWLVAVYGHTKEMSLGLHACADDLDNVAILALPDIIGPSPKDLTNILDAVVTELSSITAGNVTKTKMIETLESTAKAWNPSARCSGYRIDTLLWTPIGREFNNVGHVDGRGRVTVQSELFPNTRYGYNKRQFLVSTLEYDPFVIKRTEKIIDKSTGQPTGNFSVRYEGFVMDLLQELARVLNFTYSMIEPADQKWAGIVVEANLTFSGLIGQLQREECDIVAAPISIQARREEVVDFSYPFFYEYTTVVVKKPDPQTMKWRTLVDPFKWEVLVSIGVSLAIVTVLIFLLERYNPFYDNPEHEEARRRNGGLHYLHNSFWYMYGCLLCQGGVHLPDSIAGRTFVSCWWLTCIVVVGIYCGNLIAFLTITKEKPPFNTLEEMVQLNEYKWGTLGATNWETVFLTSTQPLFKKIGDGLREFNDTDPGVLNTGIKYHLDRVKSGGYAWIGDKTSIEIAMSTECYLIKIKDEFLPMKYAFGFPNNSPHNFIISEQIMKLHESGILQIWKRKWWPKTNFCAPSEAPEATPISLVDVQSAFYVCVCGVLIGFLAFIMEHVTQRLRKYRERKSGGNGIQCIDNSFSDVGDR